MKIKLYRILFRLFSYLSDKTNGTSLFVKYKLLMGTLIIGLVSTSAKAERKEAIEGIIPFQEPLSSEMTSCYKVVIDSSSYSNMPDRGAAKKEIVVEGNNSVKKKANLISCYAVTAIDVKSLAVEPTAIKLIDENSLIVEKELTGIMCYGIVVNPYDNDDIYTRISKKITKLPYIEIQTVPVSPVGNLEQFKKWIEEHIVYNERMLKDKVQGDVILSFAIDKQGKIVNKKVIGKLSPEADKEALRVLSSSPKWTPGEHNRKKIKTTLTMTVNFKIPE